MTKADINRLLAQLLDSGIVASDDVHWLDDDDALDDLGAPSLAPGQPTLTTPSWEEARAAERMGTVATLQMKRVQDMRDIARRRGWKVKGTTKDALAAQLADCMADPALTRAGVGALTTVQRQTLFTLALWRYDTVLTDAELQALSGLWGPPLAHEALMNNIQDLVANGWVFAGHQAARNVPYTPPLITVRHLPPLLEGVVATAAEPPPGCALALGDARACPRLANQAALLLTHTAAALRTPQETPDIAYTGEGWLWDVRELQEFKKGGSARRDLVLKAPFAPYALNDAAHRALSPAFGGAARLEFLYELLSDASIIAPVNPVSLADGAYERFAALSDARQFAALARIYLHLPVYTALRDALRADPRLHLRRAAVSYDFRAEHLIDDIERARQIVLRVLAMLPDSLWAPWDEVERALRLVWPHFERLSFRPSYSGKDLWFLACEQKDGSFEKVGPEDWDRAQGAFARHIVCEPLHWLGLADLAWRDGRLQAVRLRGLADLYWERVESLSLPSEPAAAPAAGGAPLLRYEGDAIHVAPLGVSGQAHGLLHRLARLEATTADCFVYRLDVGVVRRTFESAITLDDMLADWRRLLPAPPSPAIREQLTAWQQAYGQVRLYRDMAVIELNDDYLLDEIKAVTKLREALIAELSPRMVIVAADAVESLIAQLRKAGYTPAQITPPTA